MRFPSLKELFLAGVLTAYSFLGFGCSDESKFSLKEHAVDVMGSGGLKYLILSDSVGVFRQELFGEELGKKTYVARWGELDINREDAVILVGDHVGSDLPDILVVDSSYDINDGLYRHIVFENLGNGKFNVEDVSGKVVFE